MLLGARVFLSCGLVIYSLSAYALKPEDILGEYWKDPLFGVASAESVHRVEVLYKLLFPEQIEVLTNQKTRFVFDNRTDEVHVFLFSAEPADAMKDAEFKAFVEDEVRHARMEVSSADGHVHSNTNTDAAKSMVGTLADRPTMTIQPQDTREMIIRFDTPTKLVLRCVIEGHADHGHESYIQVLDGGFFADGES
ncbi:hypothetical protein A3742_00900 [Oleiphilus sp. HI0071]|uniref:hypothetical protein n=3 Tax=unclassified Oleiphilus TaxID=2631174 RepID=UPI0007C2EBBE|nr:hypothetical protein [Oleiphilus sp. HI0079]KZY71078.1 hypothetical protein A3737_12065 [Oleiphilus sp. HI0065]KZY83011.1 hypothetical protein A3742_00900 [Oleiphilus sp. HI0071]KZY93565.1 hypothetical protein A3744_14030 [Oleiphilus sp. HI0073]KZZ40716.1 hypothetical protein A3758_08345 [Oleiphilus sp. HI0118]KZZ51848.1 hypothetical protein A3760_12020 [Oleiphilus sp. HI0122]KZZ66148.1 hypothetical protein A3765_05325 [Oleiphilus sp. HI0130]KZZ82249.1 hypothetical protein A3767_04290 [Ol